MEGEDNLPHLDGDHVRNQEAAVHLDVAAEAVFSRGESRTEAGFLQSSRQQVEQPRDPLRHPVWRRGFDIAAFAKVQVRQSGDAARREESEGLERHDDRRRNNPLGRHQEEGRRRLSDAFHPPWVPGTFVIFFGGQILFSTVIS